MFKAHIDPIEIAMLGFGFVGGLVLVFLNLGVLLHGFGL
jgi:hypothetical protein